MPGGNPQEATTKSAEKASSESAGRDEKAAGGAGGKTPSGERRQFVRHRVRFDPRASPGAVMTEEEAQRIADEILKREAPKEPKKED